MNQCGVRVCNRIDMKNLNNIIDTQFFIGDVVVLKTGSPKMTISEIDMISGEIRCIWYANGKCEMQILNPDLVQKFNLVRFKAS